MSVIVSSRHASGWHRGDRELDDALEIETSDVHALRERLGADARADLRWLLTRGRFTVAHDRLRVVADDFAGAPETLRHLARVAAALAGAAVAKSPFR